MALRWFCAVLLALPGVWGERGHGGERGCVGVGPRGKEGLGGVGLGLRGEGLRGAPAIIRPPHAGR